MLGMSTVQLSLDEIYALAHECLRSAGASDANADAIATNLHNAERDGAVSHGLFRLPGYVASLKSGKVNGLAEPDIKSITPVIIHCDANNGHAPLALQRSLPVLADAARKYGVAALGIVRSAHFAALWPETEYLAEHGLVGIACVSYKPVVAPAGAREALFGTNPIAFSWPRKNGPAMVFDMATAAKALGDIQIAARDGHEMEPGTGLDQTGAPTNDPNEILKGVLLPFGGYKGSAIAMMIELLSAAMIGDGFSFQTAERDNNDGGPPPRGEFVLALSPDIMGEKNWQEHSEAFFGKLEALEGTRLPGDRRYRMRGNLGPREVNAELVAKIRALAG